MKVIEIAEAEIGYQDDNGKSKYFSELFPGEKSKPWCVPFLEWCFQKAYEKEKALELLNLSEFTQSVIALMNYFKQANKWYWNRAKVGWLVFIRSTNEATNHCELIIDVTDDEITTIGGNVDGEVKKSTYLRSDERIAGYGAISYGGL